MPLQAWSKGFSSKRKKGKASPYLEAGQAEWQLVKSAAASACASLASVLGAVSGAAEAATSRGAEDHLSFNGDEAESLWCWQQQQAFDASSILHSIKGEQSKVSNVLLALVVKHHKDLAD